MTVAQWQPGTTYVPGAVVVPTHTPATQLATLNNPGFETGDLTDWTQTSTGTGTFSVIAGGYAGSHCCKCIGTGTNKLTNTTQTAISPGQSVSAQCFLSIDNVGGSDNTSTTMMLFWYDSTGTFISATGGNPVQGQGGFWETASVQGVAPGNAAFLQIGLECNCGTSGSILEFDNFSWSAVFNAPPVGLVYQATQAAPGKSGATEPNWPGNTTTPVTDNQVTWQGIIATQIVWTAVPINISGSTQPTWATEPGSSTYDNGIDWVAYAFNIQDSNCPNTPVVMIAASKIYAADNDIVRYSATANPLDWSSANNAGYLPFGMQTYGSEPASVMNLYRSNLVIFSGEGFQMWQVNEDPSVTALIDALPIATTWNLAASPMANDLLFLSKAGIRSLGISATAEGLETGDIGMPIDVLIQQYLTAATADNTGIIGTYIPEYSQYWIIFPQANVTDTTTAFVYTLNQLDQPGKWSRYLFPFRIDYLARLNGDLYIRSGNDVLMFDPTAIDDFEGDPQGRQIGFEGIVQWLWLDDEMPGIKKQWVGCDLTCASGNPSVALFYDQSNLSLGTTPYPVSADTQPGEMIPIPVVAPSCSLQVTFGPSAPWKLLQANLWLNVMRPTS